MKIYLQTKITLYEEDKKGEASMRCSLLHGSWDQILQRPPSICKLFLFHTIWIGITKFPPNLHHGILSAGKENGGQWPWPSRSFWLWILGIWLVHAITCIRLGWNQQMCTLGYSLLVLKMVGIIDLDLQGHLVHFDSEFWEIWLVCVTTCNLFKLESPNMHL